MFIVYLLEFKDSEEVYIGLSDNLNWQLELESKFFEVNYKLEVEKVTTLYFSNKQNDAIIEKSMWLTKTERHNINSRLTKDIPDSFISKSLKDKKTIQTAIKDLESRYIGLYYEYKIMKENSSQLNDIIERAIRESIEKWKDSEGEDSEYDRNGFDSNGFDVEGYDELGYDRSGFDFDGLDREGYDINGCDISGLTKDGYDEQGYDIYGYDKSGFDDAGYNKNNQHRDDLKEKQ